MLALLFDLLSVGGLFFAFYLVRLLNKEIKELKAEVEKQITFEKNISANNDEFVHHRLTSTITQTKEELKKSIEDLENQIYSDLDIRRNQRKNY